MKGINIIINQAAMEIAGKQLVELSIPFAFGHLSSNDCLKVIESHQPLHFYPLNYWTDGSVKWARCYFRLGPEFNGVDSLTVEKDEDSRLRGNDEIECGSDELKYGNDLAECGEQVVSNSPTQDSDKNESATTLVPRLFDWRSKLLTLEFTDGQEQPHSLALTQKCFERLVEPRPNEAAPIEITRALYTGTLSAFPYLNFQVEQTHYVSEGLTKNSITIHNTNRAQHIDGQWDLGDENSTLFRSLVLNVNGQTKTAVVTELREKSQVHVNAPFRLIQHSSGGENWDYTTHVNAENQMPLSKNGYELEVDGVTKSGKRFEPLLSCQLVNSQQPPLSIYMADFWQNFPSAMSLSTRGVELGLFPAVDYLHELLPGERKTHDVWLSSNSTVNAFEQSQQLKQAFVCPNYLAQTAAIPFFASEIESDYQKLIANSLDKEKGLQAKKELVDEYGWRNFGDLYADHENAEFKGNRPIVSHYNNQYDPLYGLIRQHLKSGDMAWQKLFESLAQHVTDIDIYHTQLDRVEYNGGLFWHTDHYVDAATAGHRTYSKNQPTDVYMDHAGGGGPGGQHCYTTGLMLHHMLTGESRSKAAVLTLTKWITHVYEGTGGVLDFLLAYKNKTRADLKNVLTGQYPLDRGTGHYIIALLDSYQLTGQQSWLDKASLVIKHTFHPSEDIAKRGLDNVEETWFYTVFLQAVCRYLWEKENAQQQDESYDYAVQVLVKFADWMSENEQPYLMKPEILEFPNSTWTAQDMRKVNVLHAAASYVEDGSRYLAKADEIYRYVVEQLSQDDNIDYCRIQCLLMQNEGWRAYYKKHKRVWRNMVEWHKQPTERQPSLFALLMSRIADFSLERELQWLAGRSEKLHKMLNKR